MKETAIANEIIKALRAELKRRGIFPYIRKVHGGPMQHAGLPDLHLCVFGHSFWIEVKRPGERPTVRQLNEHNILRQAGATVAVATSVDEALNALDALLLIGVENL